MKVRHQNEGGPSAVLTITLESVREQKLFRTLMAASSQEIMDVINAPKNLQSERPFTSDEVKSIIDPISATWKR